MDGKTAFLWAYRIINQITKKRELHLFWFNVLGECIDVQNWLENTRIAHEIISENIVRDALMPFCYRKPMPWKRSWQPVLLAVSKALTSRGFVSIDEPLREKMVSKMLQTKCWGDKKETPEPALTRNVGGVKTQFADGQVLKIWREGFGGREVIEVKVAMSYAAQPHASNGYTVPFVYHVLVRTDNGLELCKATDDELRAQLVAS